MKKVKTILIAVVVGLTYSCSKSDLIEPISLQDGPHKKDTAINNFIPRIITPNK